MHVKLIAHTPQPDQVVAAAARVCYSPLGGDDLMKNFQEGEASQLVKKLMAMGHESPLEHITFTFAIDGVSRALSHQLVRHRIGVSFSQKSQRYIKEDFNRSQMVIPPSIEKDAVLRETMASCLQTIRETYEKLLQEIPAEDARYILPNATATNLVVTFNARSLLHFLELRCCRRAQWEIRALAEQLRAEARRVCPVIFAQAGATCETLGICFEGAYSCGRCDTVRQRSKES